MTDPLTLYADLYRDFSECVPEEWEFTPADEYEVACVETEVICLFFDPDAHHPWFLDLARQSVENRLEAGGWSQGTRYDVAAGRMSGYWWHQNSTGQETDLETCPHAAACSAYRAMKEQE